MRSEGRSQPRSGISVHTLSTSPSNKGPELPGLPGTERARLQGLRPTVLRTGMHRPADANSGPHFVGDVLSLPSERQLCGGVK